MSAGTNGTARLRIIDWAAVVECASCHRIWANVRPRAGGNKWVELDREMATSPYFDLLTPPEEEVQP